MSLEPRAANGTSGYQYPVDGESGAVLSSRSAETSATEETIIRDPETGACVIHGVGHDETIQFSFEGTALANGVRNTSIGDDYDFNVPFSVGAHNSANKTHVMTSMAEPHSLGDFKKFNGGGRVLPF